MAQHHEDAGAGASSYNRPIASDRPPSTCESAVALFLAAALSAEGVEAIRGQLDGGRVAVESSCCASVHIIANYHSGLPAPVTEVTAIEARSRTTPSECVRLVLASDDFISHLELVHAPEVDGSRVFPAPSELEPPTVRPY